MIQTFADCLSALADRGLHVRRIAGDELEAVGDGDLDEEIVAALRRHRDEFLDLLPDPVVEVDRERARAIEQVNAILSRHPLWFGSPEQWADMDAIEQEFDRAKLTGDLDVARAAGRQYIRWAEQVAAVEQVHDWCDEDGDVAIRPAPPEQPTIEDAYDVQVVMDTHTYETWRQCSRCLTRIVDGDACVVCREW